MADPMRLVILKALCAHIEAQVRISNGFQHDLQGRVFRGRSVFGQDDPLPMVSVLEAPRPDQDQSSRIHRQAPHHVPGLRAYVS